jgi:hypothetical protein
VHIPFNYTLNSNVVNCIELISECEIPNLSGKNIRFAENVTSRVILYQENITYQCVDGYGFTASEKGYSIKTSICGKTGEFDLLHSCQKKGNMNLLNYVHVVALRDMVIISKDLINVEGWKISLSRLIKSNTETDRSEFNTNSVTFLKTDYTWNGINLTIPH